MLILIISHTDKKADVFSRSYMDYSVTGAGIPKSASLQKDMGMQGSHRIIAQAFSRNFSSLVPEILYCRKQQIEIIEFGLSNYLKVNVEFSSRQSLSLLCSNLLRE